MRWVSISLCAKWLLKKILTHTRKDGKGQTAEPAKYSLHSEEIKMLSAVILFSHFMCTRSSCLLPPGGGVGVLQLTRDQRMVFSLLQMNMTMIRFRMFFSHNSKGDNSDIKAPISVIVMGRNGKGFSLKKILYKLQL